MLQTLGTILIFLLCPLMMIFMMKGMHGGHDGHSSDGQPRKRFKSKEEEMADLRIQLENLQTQYNRLAAEVNVDMPSGEQPDRYKEIHL